MDLSPSSPSFFTQQKTREPRCPLHSPSAPQLNQPNPTFFGPPELPEIAGALRADTLSSTWRAPRAPAPWPDQRPPEPAPTASTRATPPLTRWRRTRASPAPARRRPMHVAHCRPLPEPLLTYKRPRSLSRTLSLPVALPCLLYPTPSKILFSLVLCRRGTREVHLGPMILP